MDSGQRFARIIREEHGIELTPDQAAKELRHGILEMIQEKMIKEGRDIPEDIDEFAAYMKNLYKEHLRATKKKLTD